VPYKHPKYKKYFTDQPAEIALTYEWTSSFRHLKTFLSKDNVRRHNRLSLDPNPSPLHRLYLLSFLWVFLGPPTLLPEDMDERTIFIDIMFNDQNSIDITRELAAAEREYEGGRWHVVVATETVLERAWCLYEIAVRRGAGGRSQMVGAGGGEGAGIEQVALSMLGPLGILVAMFWRIIGVFSVPLHLVGAVMRLVWGIHLGSQISTLGSAGATTDAAGNEKKYFDDMKASVEEDKNTIRARITQVFGDGKAFDQIISAATVRARCSRLELALLLWLETGLGLACLPAHAASAAASLVVVGAWVLCHLALRVCGMRLYAASEDDPVITAGMSRLGASAFNVWVCIDMAIMFPILGAVAAAIWPAWAAAAALLLCLGVCIGGLRRRGGGADGGGEGRGSGWEMAGVVALGLASPVLAPLAGIAAGLIAFAYLLSMCSITRVDAGAGGGGGADDGGAGVSGAVVHADAEGGARDAAGAGGGDAAAVRG
jgi:hypothetical protein